MRILLSKNSLVSPLIGRFLLIIMGLVLMIQSFLHLASRPIQYDILLFLDLAILFAGIWVFVMAIFILSNRSKYVPRVEISELSILIHNHTFGKTHTVDLQKLSKVIFGSYELTFVEKEGNYYTHRLNTRKTSEAMKIKEELRKEAIKLNIEIDDELSAIYR